MGNIIDFATWLKTEMDKRNLRPIDIAKRGDITGATISRILSTERRAGPETCVAIARALRMPPEDIFRRAGLLPELTVPGPNTRELTYLFEQLSETDQKEVLIFIRGYIREKLLDYRGSGSDSGTG